MIQDIADALVQSWHNFATAFVQFVPRLVAATIIFAGGFVVALVVRRTVRRLLAWLHFDRLSLRTGASDMLRVADMPTAEVLVAKIVFWIVWIGFIVSAVDTLQFKPFQGLVGEFFRLVPRFLVALLVLSLGFLIGNFLWRATLLSSVNAGLPGARLLSGALRVLVIAIGAVMALEQLGLATTVALTAFAITFGALMLGLAIAFGLGGRDAAKQLIEQSFAPGNNRTRTPRPTCSVMSFHRVSGVLLHPTSLPAAVDVGDLGRGAFEFIDFLASAGQRLWQVLPLGPTGYGNSPYQGFSAFAGNPLLISLERLIEDGLLTDEESRRPSDAQPGSVDFPAVIAHRRAIWPRVLDRFEARAAPSLRDRFDAFCRTHAGWLDDFALFMAVKDAHHQVAWTAWEPDIAHRDPSAIARWSAGLAREVRLHKLTQFLFFEQWRRVREACHARSIHIMGDLPIFVAHDSADVWARRELFRLDAAGRPAVLTGVPPDYFSATGQLWGNPHYQWEVLARTGYAWWIDRFRALLALVDRVRIDHFRGFEASWEVPADAATAMHGEWVKGPGASLFEAVQSAFETDRLPFVAENLGVITPEVESLRARFGLPGMAILQFAFGNDPQAPSFRPHNYPRNLVVYTGTHDNDTTAGWWTGTDGHSTRSDAEIESEREHARRYLDLDGREPHWAFIRAVLASVADTAIVPAQDLLGLGSDTRMNRPGTLSGNWRWRLVPGQLARGTAQKLAVLTETYGRS